MWSLLCLRLLTIELATALPSSKVVASFSFQATHNCHAYPIIGRDDAAGLSESCSTPLPGFNLKGCGWDETNQDSASLS